MKIFDSDTLCTRSEIKQTGGVYKLTLEFNVLPQNDDLMRRFSQLGGRRLKIECPSWEELFGLSELTVKVEVPNE